MAGSVLMSQPATMIPMVLTSADGISLHVYRGLPKGTPKAAVQIVHGLAEHAGRYARLTEALTAAGYAVYAQDLRGHGRTAATPEEFGFFAEKDGWQKCLDDLWQVNRRIAADNPGMPVLLLGHSMGSFLAQQFISEHGDALAGVVLSASSGKPGAQALAVRGVVQAEKFRLGPRGRSALVQKMVFGACNKPFEPARTPYDWLSRDPVEVDKYAADPFCAFPPTVQLWIDFLDAMDDLSRPGLLKRIPKNLPVYIIAGTRDPVSDNTQNLSQLIIAYRAAGLKKVSYRYYSEARHELFNETNRDEVTRNLIKWLDQILSQSGTT